MFIVCYSKAGESLPHVVERWGEEGLELQCRLKEYDEAVQYSEWTATRLNADLWVELDDGSWETNHWGNWQTVELSGDWVKDIIAIYEQEGE